MSKMPLSRSKVDRRKSISAFFGQELASTKIEHPTFLIFLKKIQFQKFQEFSRNLVHISPRPSHYSLIGP